ncbi:CD209 antigen-like protein E [Ostrea edulis]|uniref:CD209 antigen-like protein E n=1 Tax=Ostrea edulis TaxID=37623 RepID=UPI0020960995|nr:CD209 antigen-like protein E [Ostrea edulis]
MADSMTGSVEQCAVECVTVSCAAFLYDTSAMTCRQLSKPLTADIITTHPEMKAVQYYLSDIGCGEDDWTLYRKHCYRYYDIELSWDNAKTVCEGDNSSLVQLETADEASWLLSTIVPNGEPVDPFNNCTWVGATDREVEGTFKWIVGYGDITSLPWYGRQPDNSHGGQDCLAVMRNAHFDDAKCADRKVFVCEKEH